MKTDNTANNAANIAASIAKNFAASIAQSLDKLIESAPGDIVPQDNSDAPQVPLYVREEHGWGKRYCREIELHGEEWISAFNIAADFVAGGAILVLVGDRGPGKTQMAAEIARGGRWPCDKRTTRRSDKGVGMESRKTAIYTRAMDIFINLAHARKDHVKSSEKEVLDGLANVGLLVIDECHERGETEAENRKLNNLLDKRYSDYRPTIIIANTTRQETFAALGASIVDRAIENGKSIEFTWPSYRARNSH